MVANFRKLVALVVVLAPSVSAAEGFDAIFYRARPGFNFCYSLQARVGWSERPVASPISHSAGTACPAKSPPLTSDQLAGTNDCSGGCSADCGAYVFKSWAINTSPSLTRIDSPDECANASGASGLSKIVANDAHRARAAARLEPGDDCENTGHASLLVARNSDGTWRTWEAHGSASGIGPGTRDPATFVTEDDGRTPCGSAANNGCWRPSRARTGAPALELPSNGAKLDDPSKLTFRFRAPDNFPAIGDYLFWIYWDNHEGQSGKQPDIQHRLVRIPAFTHRFDDETRRLAHLPNASSACPNNAGETCPLDVSDGAELEISANTLANALAVQPLDFKLPDGGSVRTTWDSTLVPCIDTAPATYSAQRACGDGGFRQAAPLSFVPGRTYHWQVRVERYGEERSGHFARAQAIGPCALTQAGFESEPACLDPQWSPPQTFQIAPNARCHVSFSPIAANAPDATATCPLGVGLWTVDPASIKGCLSLQRSACDSKQSDFFDVDWGWTLTDAMGNGLGNGFCGLVSTSFRTTAASCQEVLDGVTKACNGQSSCGMDPNGNPVFCAVCNCSNGSPPWSGPGSITFSSSLAQGTCDNMGGAPAAGSIAFDVVSCTDPSVSQLSFCHPPGQ